MIKGYFAKDECDDHMEFHVVDTDDEAQKIVKGWDNDDHGICSYDHDTKENKKGDIVLRKVYLDIYLLIHECSHACLEWVAHQASIIFDENSDPQDVNEYYSEALARSMENIVKGVVEKGLINGDPNKSN